MSLSSLISRLFGKDDSRSAATMSASGVSLDTPLHLYAPFLAKRLQLPSGFLPSCTRFVYVQQVTDGDTVRMDIDHGCDVWQRNVGARLYGINAPETKGATKQKGDEATQFLETMVAKYSLDGDCLFLGKLHPGRDVDPTVRSNWFDKYGRVLVEIIGKDEKDRPVHFNEEMVRRGYAVSYLPD